MPSTREAELLTTESTLTSRGQTTIPSAIRQALDLRAADKLRFSLRSDNTVVLTRAEPAGELESDPLIDRFLDFLEKDMTDHPNHIRAVTSSTVMSARALVEGVEVDLDAPLEDDDE